MTPKEDKSKTQLTNYRTIIHYGVETITTQKFLLNILSFERPELKIEKFGSN